MFANLLSYGRNIIGHTFVLVRGHERKDWIITADRGGAVNCSTWRHTPVACHMLLLHELCWGTLVQKATLNKFDDIKLESQRCRDCGMLCECWGPGWVTMTSWTFTLLLSSAPTLPHYWPFRWFSWCSDQGARPPETCVGLHWKIKSLPPPPPPAASTKLHKLLNSFKPRGLASSFLLSLGEVLCSIHQTAVKQCQNRTTLSRYRASSSLWVILLGTNCKTEEIWLAERHWAKTLRISPYGDCGGKESGQEMLRKDPVS